MSVDAGLLDGGIPEHLKRISAIARLSGPEIRTMEIPASPGAVEIAAIVSLLEYVFVVVTIYLFYVCLFIGNL